MRFPFSLLSQCHYSHALRIITPHYRSTIFRYMTTEKPSPAPITARAKLTKLQQLLHSDSTDGWDECWKEGITPWDLGGPTPVLLHLHDTGFLPNGRALLPGCGTVAMYESQDGLKETQQISRLGWESQHRAQFYGHDAVAIACAERHVVGLDISDNAIKKAAELYSGSPNAEHFTFLKTDFFTWCPAELFDLIFDYTFFCAIEPEFRSLWARKISDLLKLDGELITLMYPIDEREGGPPYKVSISDYEEVLHPVGFKATYIADNELAIAPRMGREKLGRWKRSVSLSSL